VSLIGCHIGETLRRVRAYITLMGTLEKVENP
jgi:hypothetical protein